MDRSKLIVEEARLNDGRELAAARAAELTQEVDTLIAAARVLGERLSFDDQSSDFMHVALTLSPHRHDT